MTFAVRDMGVKAGMVVLFFGPCLSFIRHNVLLGNEGQKDVINVTQWEYAKHDGVMQKPASADTR